MINCLDEKFCDHDLNTKGKQFAKAYYEDGTSFAKAYKNYFGDYAQIFQIKVVDNYLEQDALYRVENTWQNYDYIKTKITERFAEWQVFKGK